MMKIILRMTCAVALVLALTATGLWAGGGTDTEPTAAADKKYVTDPTTGKVVTAPEYGGTITYPHTIIGENTDPFARGGEAAHQIGSVNEHLGWGN